MSKEKFTATDIIREYADKYPDMPTATLASLIYSQNKKYFSTKENVRTMLRGVRGKQGQTKYKKDAHRHETERRSTAPYKLPEGLSDEIEPFYMPKKHNKVLVLSDLHVPYHDARALKLAVEYGKSKGVNAVFLNGDIADCYTQSRFLTDPRKRDTLHEIETVKAVLKWLKGQLPGVPIYFAHGNHDKRYEHYMMIHAPELLGVAEFRFESIFGLDELGIISLKVNQKMIIGNGLNVIHGDTIFRGFGAGVSPARSAFMKTNESILVGHVHRTTEYTSISLSGSMVTAWSTGCLCDLNPAYVPHASSYNHGFAFVEVNKNGDFFVENKRIHKGKIL